MQEVLFQDLGTIDYQAAWQYQEKLFGETLTLKSAQHKNPQLKDATRDYLLFCEHPHTYTLGKSGKREHLMVSEERLEALGASFYPINRGGDITYHGPGQLVGYPILNLDHFFTDIHRYLRTLEEIFIKVMAHYGLKGERSNGETGVWLDTGTPRARKILALGVRAARWVTMHGWAFNVNTDLSYFNHIIPCGIRGKGVSSLQQELGQAIPMAEVSHLARQYFAEAFEVELKNYL